MIEIIKNDLLFIKAIEWVFKWFTMKNCKMMPVGIEFVLECVFLLK